MTRTPDTVADMKTNFPCGTAVLTDSLRRLMVSSRHNHQSAKSSCWGPWNSLRPSFRAQRDNETHILRDDSSVIRRMNFLTMSGVLMTVVNV